MKATVQRPAWAGSASQRRDSQKRGSAGLRLVAGGRGLPLPRGAEEGEMKVDDVALHLTHLNKAYFPEGTTKRDLLDYSYDVAEFLLPHLRDRPYTMKRFPNGIEGHAFFQKEAGPHMPAWVRTEPVASQGERDHINFVLCNDCPTLLFLVNFGCIDHNIWMSRYSTPLSPDFVLLDLDPGERAPFAMVVKVAQAVRAVLEKYEIRGYPKTSGATGMHIWIPLAPGHTFTQSAQFAEIVLRMAAAREPELTTDIWQVARRPQTKVYLDFRQNAHGKTIPPPYSPRPHAGAPVSTPLQWSEVGPKLDPAKFTIRSVRRRLEKHGDLFAGALPAAAGQNIATMLTRMNTQATNDKK